MVSNRQLGIIYLFATGLEHFNLKIYQNGIMVQKLQPFFWMHGIFPLVELHWKGFAINRATVSSSKFSA